LILGLSALTLALHTRDQVGTIRAAFARMPIALSLPLSLTIILACTILAAGRPETFYYFDF
jgi:alginate O-acetyltransferase complex protein AlgI